MWQVSGKVLLPWAGYAIGLGVVFTYSAESRFHEDPMLRQSENSKQHWRFRELRMSARRLPA